MIFDLIRDIAAGADVRQVLPQIALIAICVLFALTFHECAHGFIAYKLGDPTARNLGRLTLDPVKHLDPIGTLCMLLFGFGWAKPVPVNSRYFKKPKRDMALTAIAGPVSNLILSFFGLLLEYILIKLFPAASLYGSFGMKIAYILILLFAYFHTLNLYLAIFNLIPIPPLDGSRLLFLFLPDRFYFGLMKYERIIMLVMMVLLWTGVLSVPISGLCSLISSGMSFLIKLIPGL